MRKKALIAMKYSVLSDGLTLTALAVSINREALTRLELERSLNICRYPARIFFHIDACRNCRELYFGL